MSSEVDQNTNFRGPAAAKKPADAGFAVTYIEHIRPLSFALPTGEAGLVAPSSAPFDA